MTRSRRTRKSAVQHEEGIAAPIAGRKLFGTDGIRGVANLHPMTAEVAMKLGRALAHIIAHGDHRQLVIIGKDTRLSGYMLEQALASGLMSMGVDVAFVGPMPTPAIAHLTTSMRADAGAVISASHNSYEDNGIKFFSRDGFKLPDETEERIEAILLGNALDSHRPTATKVGAAVRLEDARGRYIAAVKATFPRNLTLEGLTLVVDCANGAGYRTMPAVLTELGAKVIPLGVEPDGTNINAGCGAVAPKALQRAVVAAKAHLGLALDGDADRLVVVDERGNLVAGDAVLAICAADLEARGLLKRRTMVATVMSSMGLDRALARSKIKVIRTGVGDRYVVDAMRKGGYVFGGEQSGHLIFMDHATTGDGTLAALQLLAVLCRSQKTMREMSTVYEPVPQVLRNLRVRERRDLSRLPLAQHAIAKSRTALAQSGRVLVRFSGTEALIRILVEGTNEAAIERHADSIAAAIQKDLA